MSMDDFIVHAAVGCGCEMLRLGGSGWLSGTPSHTLLQSLITLSESHPELPFYNVEGFRAQKYMDNNNINT